MNLKGKKTIVTGGSRGIGRACALELAKQGAAVCITYQNNLAAAQDVLNQLKKISNESHRLCQFNTADTSAAEAELTQCIEGFGQLDVLVNNAGIARDNLLLRMKESEWDEVMLTNLKGVFNCSKVAAKFMLKKRQGSIINITSLSGQMGNPGQCNYAASKAGVIGFTKSLAKELASRNITVNAVSPGFIDTEMTQKLPAAQREELVKHIPLGRFGTCEEIAYLVAFLASSQASYITGQVFGINGGLYM